MKTELMLFHEDKYLGGVLTFKAGETYEIPVDTGSVTRWLKRGATIVERGYDPGKQDEKVVDLNAGENITPVEPDITPEEVTDASEITPEEEEVTPVEVDLALEALGGEEEVVNEEPKKENKKAKKSSK